MTYYAYRAYLDGLTIYSNYHLNFPHVRLSCLADIEGARHGYILLDDLEAWLSSRNWKSKDSQQVMQIILQGGKRSLQCLYSAKRPENIDVLLRDTTDFWCRCNMELDVPFVDADDFMKKSRYIDNLRLCIEVFDDDVQLVNKTYIRNLEVYSELYGSLEEIGKLVVPVVK